MQFFFEGDDFFKALRASLEKAAVSIDIEVYYFADDDVGKQFADILKKKAASGIRVRLIYDAVGSHSTSERFFKDLRESGVEAKAFHPLFPLGAHFSQRTHRKFFVIDRKDAFLGGYNLANEYSRACSGGECWRDTGVHCDRQDLVDDLIRLFQDSWEGLRAGNLARNIFAPISRATLWQRPSFIMPHYGRHRRSRIREEYLSAIIRARTSVHITNAYFVPDRGIRRALRRAAKRGVDVRILTSGISDVPVARMAAHATYARLLRNGVKIHEFQGRVLHAKSATVDAEWYTVGTANLDHLSFFKNREVNLFGRSAQEAAVLESQFTIDLGDSKEIILSEWRKRPWWKKVAERFFFLFRAWL